MTNHGLSVGANVGRLLKVGSTDGDAVVGTLVTVGATVGLPVVGSEVGAPSAHTVSVHP